MYRPDTLSDKQRVVITGIGAYTPAGDVASTKYFLEQGLSAITTLEKPFVPEITVAGQVRDFEVNHFLTRREQLATTRDVHLAQGALAHALVDAGFISSPTDLLRYRREREQEKNPIYNPDALWLNGSYRADRVGVEIGTAVGGSLSGRDEKRTVKSIFRLDVSQLSGTIAEFSNARGPSNVRVNACASSIVAVGEAFKKIRDGEADLMLAGGSEAALEDIIFRDFARMRALSIITDPEKASRPLDTQLPGFVLSEGSAMFTLENYQQASLRGAYIYGEILGFAQTTDTSSAFVPNGFAIEEAMRLAITRSGLDLKDFDRISLHAAGTSAGDPQEVMAFRRLFGSLAIRPFIETAKSTFGHALGAIGAMALFRIFLENKHQVVYTNPNIDDPIEEAKDLSLPRTGLPRERHKPGILVNGIGLEGVNASLVVC